MIEGYDKWKIQSADDLGGTYILELRLVRASNTRAPSIVGTQLGTYGLGIFQTPLALRLSII